MLMPKRTKYRKQMRGRMCGMAKGGDKISFGTYALVAEDCGWITARQIEASRIAMTRHIKRGGQVWIRIFPDKPFTKKPLEQRMGKGKASVEGWVAVVKPGRVMFEMAGPAPDVAKEAMRLAQHKLPIKCKFMMKEGFVFVPPTKAARAATVPSPVPFKADSKPASESVAPESPEPEAVATTEE